MRAVLALALASGSLLVAPLAEAQQVLTLRSLESGAVVRAQFNPTELSVNKSAPWQKHKNTGGDAPTLEFTSADPKTLQVELLFDSFEDGDDVHERFIAPLEDLAAVDPLKKRPPMIQLEWGSLPPFRGVIEKLDVKYTLFLPDGTPVRATVSLTLKEAVAVRVKQGTAGSVLECQIPTDCPAGQSCFNGACAPGS